jgi:hypothetical protein
MKLCCAGTYLHKVTLLTQMFARGDTLSQGQKLTLDDTIIEYRKRLHDISWLMRNLNEYIARETNKEDDCTGRFWEGRFKSQALLDEAVLLACMYYVDLNPIRANIANTLGMSKHTSIQKCLESIKQPATTHSLMPFVGNPRQGIPKGIVSLKDYCELVDITGRIIRNDKAGHIDHQLENAFLMEGGLVQPLTTVHNSGMRQMVGRRCIGLRWWV